MQVGKSMGWFRVRCLPEVAAAGLGCDWFR